MGALDDPALFAVAVATDFGAQAGIAPGQRRIVRQDLPQRILRALTSALALGAAWLLLSLQPEVPAAADSNPGDEATRLPQTAEGTARADDTPSMPASDTSTSPASSAPTGAAPDLLAELPVLEQRLADGDIAAGWRAYGKLRECAYRSAAATSAAV